MIILDNKYWCVEVTMDNTFFSISLPFAAFFTLRDESRFRNDVTIDDNLTFYLSDKAKIDNFPDRLHYKFTAGFLFLATAVLSMDGQWGDVSRTRPEPPGLEIRIYCHVAEHPVHAQRPGRRSEWSTSSCDSVLLGDGHIHHHG